MQVEKGIYYYFNGYTVKEFIELLKRFPENSEILINNDVDRLEYSPNAIALDEYGNTIVS